MNPNPNPNPKIDEVRQESATGGNVQSLYNHLGSKCSHQSISGLMVKSIVAIDGLRVRFPADAKKTYSVSIFFFFTGFPPK